MLFEAQADCKRVPSSSGVKERRGSRGVRDQCFTVGFLNFNFVTTVPKFCDYFKILHFKSQDIRDSCWGIKLSSLIPGLEEDWTEGKKKL